MNFNGRTPAACWAHARRKFHDVHQATASPITAEARRRIAELYGVEKRIRLHDLPNRRFSAPDREFGKDREPV
jgi:hypothetical protein